MEIEKYYTNLGGTFVTPLHQIKIKLQNIKAILFDWDGVFNNGTKSANGGSNFSEVDSMGTNLLRYSHFLKTKQLPITGVISGEKNETALYFCKRERFNYSFFKVANKMLALNFICENNNIKPHEVAYFFDDVLDLSVAELCGIRIQINQKSNPLFINYCIKNKLVDYLTASSGGNFAVREATELLMGINDTFDKVIADRKSTTAEYKTYIEKRNTVETTFYTVIDNQISPVDILTA